MPNTASPTPLHPLAKTTKSRRLIVVIVALLVAVVATTGVWHLTFGNRLQDSLTAADRAMAAGDVKTAYSYLQKAAAAAPPSADLLERLATLATQLDLLEESELWISKLPSTELARTGRLQLAVVQKGMEVSDAARVERLLLAIIERDPGQFAARQMLAHLYLMTLRQNDLRNQIAEIDQRFPDRRPGTNLLLLYCTGTLGQWLDKEPREWLERAAERDPANSSVRASLAQLLIQSDERERARTLLAAGPQSADHWYVALVQVRDLLDTDRLNEAAAILAEIQPACWSDSRFWIARGRVAAEHQRTEVAKTAFEVAARIDPFDPEPPYRLGRLLLKEGDRQKSDELLQRSNRLGQLNRAAKRVMGSTQGKGTRGELEDTAAMANELGFKRLSLLLYTALAGDFPDLAAARAKVAELRSDPMSQQTLFNPLKVEIPRSHLEQVPGSSLIGKKGGQPPAANSVPAIDTSSAPRFVDVASSVGLNFSYFRAPSPSGKPLMMNVIGGGIAVLDFDADGWPDLYFPQGTPLPLPSIPDDKVGRLFRNVRGHHFEDVTLAARAADYGFGQGCSVADFDNDGFADLLVCHYGFLRFYRNNGDGTFRDWTSASGLQDNRWSTSAAFGDFDRDGDLDLFVVHYITADWPTDKCCLPVEFPKSRNSLWVNRGDGTFVEQSEALSAEAYGLAVIVEDLDNDGWPDIYLANDMTPNLLYHNLGGTPGTKKSGIVLVETAVASGVAVNGKGEVEAGMGLSCGDVDGNGFIDLFVTNFQEETNTLYRNHGELAFTDDTARMGLLDLNPPKMGWGCQFLDSLGTGRLDLFYLNSHLKIDGPQTPSFFLNAGKRFQELKLDLPYFHKERMGRAAALMDWNRDLKPDIVAGYLRDNVSLLTNESPLGHRITVELIGTSSNRDGESARIFVQQGSKEAVYRFSRGGGFLCANEKQVSIGLGSARESRWAILWPNGQRQECGPCRAGTRYRVIEGRSPEAIGDL